MRGTVAGSLFQPRAPSRLGVGLLKHNLQEISSQSLYQSCLSSVMFGIHVLEDPYNVLRDQTTLTIRVGSLDNSFVHLGPRAESTVDGVLLVTWRLAPPGA